MKLHRQILQQPLYWPTPQFFRQLALRVALLFQFLLVGSVHAQNTTAEWQARAIAEWPELGRPKSAFHKLFLEKAALLREKSPKTLEDPSWPYRLASRIAEHPELWLSPQKTTPSDPSPPPLSSPEKSPVTALKGPADLSSPIATCCISAVEKTLASKGSKQKSEDWIAAGKIISSQRTQALLLANTQVPEFKTVFCNYLKSVIATSEPNTAEDEIWLEAALCAHALFAPAAALLGMEPKDLVFSLFAKVDNLPFVSKWLWGGVKTQKIGSPVPVSLRSAMLGKIKKNNLRIGRLTMSKDSFYWLCIESNTLFSGAGFSLLEDLPFAEWPESFLKSTKAPPSAFNPGEKDWAEYLKKLRQMDEEILAKGFSSSPPQTDTTPHPLRLESYLLWRAHRARTASDGVSWLMEISQKLAAHPSAQVRNTKRILPAIFYLLKQPTETVSGSTAGRGSP